MKVLIDTNILISAIISNGAPYKAYIKAVSYPYQGVICDQNVVELRRIFNRKFSRHIEDMEMFLAIALQTLELVHVPDKEIEQEKQIRDINDRPILRAAIHAGVDILLTGDKDFLESGITKPVIMTANQFLEL